MEGAWTATMWWLTALDGPLPIGDIVYGIGIVVETALLIQTVDTIINNSVPEVLESSGPPPRDSEGNPIPMGNQSPGPLGKGVNAGAEDIPNPGSFGNPGNKPEPPEPEDPHYTPYVVGATLATVALLEDNNKDFNQTLSESATENESQEEKKND